MTHDELLSTLGGDEIPTPDQFRSLVSELDEHRILAKVWLLENTPYVFESNHMKYVIFREHVASRFNIGSQDVCIVGSAKLGFSPSPHKYGTRFETTSDVDVVIISDTLFDQGTRELFSVLNHLEPTVFEVRRYMNNQNGVVQPVIRPEIWIDVKEAIRNFIFQNFNPGLLPTNNTFRNHIFDNISSTSGLFLALEPKVFVSRIRCRVFRTWKAAEDYYTNSLRELKRSLSAQSSDPSFAHRQEPDSAYEAATDGPDIDSER